MKVWVGKNGLAHGPYAIERIELFVRNGHLTRRDWAWCVATDRWIRLEDFLAKEGRSFHGFSDLSGQSESGFESEEIAPPPASPVDDLNTRKECHEGDDAMNEKQETPEFPKGTVDPNFLKGFPDFNINLSGDGFGTAAVYPVVCKDLKADDEKFAKAVEELEMVEGSGLICVAPDKHLKRGSLDRWLHKEPRALFRRDKDEITDEVTNKSPRISWVTWDHQNAKTPDERSFNDHKIGMLDTTNKRLRIFPSLTATSFSFVSKMGIIIIVIRIGLRSGGEISLGDAMDWNYQLAHSGNFTHIPVLVPKGGVFDRELNESIDERNECPISKEKVEKCFKLWPHWEKGSKDEYDDAIKWGPKEEKAKLDSFPELIKRGIVKSLGKLYGQDIGTYQAARGRTHVFSRFLIPPDVDRIQPDKLELLEGLCARCMRHPKTSPIVPLPVKELEGAEFHLFHVTGSQRVYLSCEGALTIGVQSTEFDRVWQERWEHDYLLCHLIAYHQSILCQELSWSSFSEASGAGKEKRAEEDLNRLEELNARFIEFCTHYDFSIVSSQLNHQRIYRASREVLGVCESITEVADEIRTRLENRRNKQQQEFNKSQQESLRQQGEFNDRQEAFNSLAVVFFMLGCMTFLLNLNLKPFSTDAEITWDFSEGLESLWLWGPVGVTLLLFFSKKIRAHFGRVLKLLFKSDKQGN